MNLNFSQFVVSSLMIWAMTVGRTKRLVLEFFSEEVVNGADRVLVFW